GAKRKTGVLMGGRVVHARERGCVAMAFVDASPRSCPSSSTPKPISTTRSPVSSTPIHASASCCRGRGGRRCGDGRTDFPALPRSSSRSSSRPRASSRSGRDSPTPSTRALPPSHPGAVPRGRYAGLRRAGLSAPKIRTLKAIAKAIDRGNLDLPALVKQPADEAHAALTAVHGIGPWTADIYLLFCLGH